MPSSFDPRDLPFTAQANPGLVAAFARARALRDNGTSSSLSNNPAAPITPSALGSTPGQDEQSAPEDMNLDFGTGAGEQARPEQQPRRRAGLINALAALQAGPEFAPIAEHFLGEDQREAQAARPQVVQGGIYSRDKGFEEAPWAKATRESSAEFRDNQLAQQRRIANDRIRLELTKKFGPAGGAEFDQLSQHHDALQQAYDQASREKDPETAGLIRTKLTEVAQRLDTVARTAGIAAGAAAQQRPLTILQEHQIAAQQQRAEASAAKDQAAQSKDAREDIDALRREYTARVAPYRPSIDASRQIETLSNDPATKTSATQQLAMVYAIGKLLDPNSVVRESEVALYQSGQSWFALAGQMIRQKLEGGQVLTQAQLSDMTAMARKLAGSANRGIDAVRSDLDEVVRQRKYDPRLIFGANGRGLAPKSAAPSIKPGPTVQGGKAPIQGSSKPVDD